MMEPDIGWTRVFAALAALTAACSAPSDAADPRGSAGATGGGGGGGGPATTDPVTVVPDTSGWVDRAASWNGIGIQGAWYPYGDQYGKAKCTTVGLHMPSECSSISAPDPLLTGFPNDGGIMCTRGEVAAIVPCKPNVPRCNVGTPDYSNVWGAGIGLDLNALGADQGGVKSPWDPDANGVTGVRFTIDRLPAARLRVEFPIQLPDATTTEDHLDGSPYWGATPDYPPSQVVVGSNQFRWSDVRAPKSTYVFDRKKIVAIQFHVPAAPLHAARSAYEFCISGLTFLRD
jgi:hypothetical protein